MKPNISIIQNPLTAGSWRSYLQLLVALAILCCGSMARSQQADTWNGGGADNNWTTTNNWSPITGITTNGDDLIFGASTRTAPNNNFTALQIDSITFSTNSYALGGNASDDHQRHHGQCRFKFYQHSAYSRRVSNLPVYNRRNNE